MLLEGKKYSTKLLIIPFVAEQYFITTQALLVSKLEAPHPVV